jgi:hypothetical protein
MASPDSFRKDFTHLPILLFQRNEGMAKGWLCSRLRQARDTAAHARKGEGLTPGEAIELVRQTRYLTELLLRVNEKLPTPPRE